MKYGELPVPCIFGSSWTSLYIKLAHDSNTAYRIMPIREDEYELAGIVYFLNVEDVLLISVEGG
jgi:hypothetical protein